MDKTVDQYHPDVEKMLDELPENVKSNFYIKPRVPLNAPETDEYRAILMSMPARHRVKVPVQNLCIAYARCQVMLTNAQDQIEVEGLTTFGSQGQLVKHPLIGTVAQLTAQLQKLTQTLHLGLMEDKRTSANAANRDREEQEAYAQAKVSGLLALPKALPPQ